MVERLRAMTNTIAIHPLLDHLLSVSRLEEVKPIMIKTGAWAGTRNSDQLTLTVRETSSIIIQHGNVALVQMLDEGIHIGTWAASRIPGSI